MSGSDIAEKSVGYGIEDLGSYLYATVDCETVLTLTVRERPIDIMGRNFIDLNLPRTGAASGPAAAATTEARCAGTACLGAVRLRNRCKIKQPKIQ